MTSLTFSVERKVFKIGGNCRKEWNTFSDSNKLSATIQPTQTNWTTTPEIWKTGQFVRFLVRCPVLEIVLYTAENCYIVFHHLVIHHLYFLEQPDRYARLMTGRFVKDAHSDPTWAVGSAVFGFRSLDGRQTKLVFLCSVLRLVVTANVVSR
jgi:hypothetical protein